MTSAPAAVFVTKTFDDLVAEAELVVVGTVTAKQSVFAEDRSTIYTFVTLSEVEILLGTYPRRQLVLRVDGGEVYDVTAGTIKGVAIPGMPDFEVGERVVAFVKNNTRAMCPLVGGPQGLLRVRVDPSTRELGLFWAAGGARIVGVQAHGGFRFAAPRSSEPPYGVADLRRDVRQKAQKLDVHRVRSRAAAAVSADVRRDIGGRKRTPAAAPSVR